MRALRPALILSVVSLGTALGVPSAHALTQTTVKVPRPSGGSVAVSWPAAPAKPTTIPDGTRLRVAVSQRGAARHPVTVTFSVYSGRQPTQIRSKRLRNGVFAVRAKSKAGRRFTLTLRSGTRSIRTSTFEIAPVADAPEPGPPASSPTPPSSSVLRDLCVGLEQGTVVGTVSPLTFSPVQLATQPATAAVLVAATLSNAGTACFGRPGNAIDRLTDGQWTPLSSVPGTAETAEWFVVWPGESTRIGQFMPADSPAGTYRLRATFRGGSLGSMSGSASAEAVVEFPWSGPPAA